MPFYRDLWTTLYHADMREVIPALALKADLVLTDPPYQETAQEWDRWPKWWPHLLANHNVTRSLWCFGSMRMFLDRVGEFATWHLSQDIVWRKPNGTGFRTDRFVRVHEHALHWYRGAWGDLHHETPRDTVGVQIRGLVNRAPTPAHFHGEQGAREWSDDGTRLALSVVEARNMRMRGIHPNEKPVAVLDPLIRYACPPGGIVLDCFAGSGSTAEAARLSGRRSILIEADERWCEAAARRLSQPLLTDA